MFEDQDAARTEQSAFQDQLHDLFAALQVVGGVGEDHVELLGAAFQVEENVGLDRVEVFDPQQCGRPADEIRIRKIVRRPYEEAAWRAGAGDGFGEQEGWNR